MRAAAPAPIHTRVQQEAAPGLWKAPLLLLLVLLVLLTHQRRPRLLLHCLQSPLAERMSPGRGPRPLLPTVHRKVQLG